jgi:Holliday junction resolvase RusA-like endonuclease
VTLKEIIFTIDGEPTGKGRPKFTRQGSCVKTYTPEKTASYENWVRLEYRQQVKERGIVFDESAFLNMEITAYFSIPKATSKKKRAMMERGEIRPKKKPDVDNIFKIIADSLNGFAYKDDAQIVKGTIGKWYSDVPYVEVKISEIQKGDGI